MAITIKKTAEFEKALAIAKTLPEFFTQQGLDEIEKQLPGQMVYGAYDGEELIGCVSYKKINKQAVDIAWLFILESYQARELAPGWWKIHSPLKEGNLRCAK